MRSLLGLLLWLLAAALPLGAWAQQPVPPLSARVIDQTGTLSAAQAQALEAKLAAFEAEAGPQLVLLLVPTTQPEDIASYAQRVANAWKIGRREVGDGLLLVVAKNDRKVRIEVAKALEGAVPDLAARQIIDQAISPAFRQGDFAGGLNAATDRLMQRIRGEHLPAPAPRGGGPAGVADELFGGGWQDLAMFFFVGVPIIGMVLTGIFGRKLGSLFTAGAAGGMGWVLTASLFIAGGAAVAALVLVGLLGIGAARSGSRSMRRGGHYGSGPVIFPGGGGGGWGGGGGFGSGGGGDFGGGGASGDW